MLSLPTSALLGTQVKSPIVFEEGSYIAVDGTIVGYKGLQVDAAVITVSRQINIVSHVIPGREGEVLQYTGKKSYAISIDIRIVSPEREYPKKQVERMLSILEIPNAIGVTSPFLALFGVSSIVTTHYSISQLNYENYQSITVECLSHTPINLDDYVVN
jgi:hypothetical protein